MCIVRSDRRSDNSEIDSDIPMKPEYPTIVTINGKCGSSATTYPTIRRFSVKKFTGPEFNEIGEQLCKKGRKFVVQL